MPISLEVLRFAASIRRFECAMTVNLKDHYYIITGRIMILSIKLHRSFVTFFSEAIQDPCHYTDKEKLATSMIQVLKKVHKHKD